MKNFLSYNSDSLIFEGFTAYKGGDFWRLTMDDGYYREMTVSSSSQDNAQVAKDGESFTVTYDKIKSADRTFEVALTLFFKFDGEKYACEAEIVNRDKARVNELQFPYIDLFRGAGEREADILYRPNGLGERITSPWSALMSAHSEYMSADYSSVKSVLKYPHPATMSWMGLKSGDKFLYIARHDDKARAFSLLSAVAPRGEQPRLINALCHYPFVRFGETVKTAPCCLAVIDNGDYCDGAKIYREFAENSYYKPKTPAKWVRDMTGWQRVILRHQYGEIFFKYDDLPRLYLEGKGAGLDTLLVFGWWKGRFDNGYPHYEADLELGGADGLRKAIAEVHRLGGNVILYNNGILIDKNTDFYREHGHDVAYIDIDGNEYEDHYKFSNDGTVMINYGYKSFVHACQSTEEWKDVMVNNAKLKLSLGADSIFYDQLGGRADLCFNDKHAHGNRVDEDFVYRKRNILACSKLLNKQQAIGTEVVNDFIAPTMDYFHGCNNGCWYRRKVGENNKTMFAELYRVTFPETIMTNRFIHDCREGFREDLNYAFMMGFRLDVSIYRGRKTGIIGLPEYYNYVKKLLALKDEHHDLFYYGKFVRETTLSVPSSVRYTEYTYGKKRMFVFWNTGERVSFSALENNLSLNENEVRCLEL